MYCPSSNSNIIEPSIDIEKKKSFIASYRNVIVRFNVIMVVLLESLSCQCCPLLGFL